LYVPSGFFLLRIFPQVSDQPAAHIRNSGPEHYAAFKDIKRKASFFPLKIIRYQRVSTGRKTRFTDTDAHACKKQSPVAGSRAAGNGHAAPQRNTCEQQISPRTGVGQLAQRDAHGCIKSNERQPLNQTEFKIVDLEIGPDRANKLCNDRPVHKREGNSSSTERLRRTSRKRPKEIQERRPLVL
jgi:hypothetical protein